MPVQYENLAPISSFAGIVLASKPEIIPDNALQEANNFMLGQSGELVKRPFRAAIPSQTTPSGGTFGFMFLAQVIGFESNKVFYAGDNGTVYHCSTDFAGHTQVTGITGATSAVQFKNKLYIAAAAGVYEWTTGATATLIANSPTNGLSILLKDSRLFVISASRVYYCAAGDPLTWMSGATPMFVSVADGDGEICTGLITIGDRLLVFKNSSIHVVYTNDAPSNWTVRGVAPDTGCVGPKALINSKGLVYFIAADGIWITDGVALSRISDPISPVFAFTGRNRQNAANDTISVYDDYLLFKVNCSSYWESTTYTTMIYRYTGILKGFTESKSILSEVNLEATSPNQATIQRIVPVNNATSPFYVVFGKLSTFYKLVDTVAEQGAASGVPETVRCYMKTKAFNFDEPTRYKRVKYTTLHMYAESPAITSGSGARPAPAELKYNFITDQFQTEIIDLWQEGIFGVRSFKLRGSGFGRSHTFVFQENSKATNIQILGINFLYQLARQQDRQNL